MVNRRLFSSSILFLIVVDDVVQSAKTGNSLTGEISVTILFSQIHCKVPVEEEDEDDDDNMEVWFVGLTTRNNSGNKWKRFGIGNLNLMSDFCHLWTSAQKGGNVKERRGE